MTPVPIFPVYLLVLLVFINRYVGGFFLKKVRKRWRETREDYEPIAEVVIPLYNEGEQIFHTISRLLEVDYPPEKLTITVVDDCSTDDSHTWAKRAAAKAPGRVKVLRNPENMGKRRGINHAVRKSTAEVIISVDSDVIVEKNAFRQLMRRFVRPEIAAVGGRVNALNANENWLTRMQAIKYYFGYEYMKNLERAFNQVMCLSGCLTAYRRHVLMELEPILEDRNWFGVPIKYGEDRFLTRQIVKAGYETVSTTEAACWTIAPPTLSKYFSQQLRWRRSNIIDFWGGISHAWKLHPIVAVHYLSLYSMMIAYPIVIFDNLWKGSFWDLGIFHIAVLTFLGSVYWIDTRHYEKQSRVHPLWFIPMTVIMPATYLICTPLALFTLDSSSWETRGKPQAQPPPEEPVAQPHPGPPR
jgi:cellulose synthase/poly-beta-1,6-N-acetylglucosamine synthase-like glycosyltransferase